MADARDRALAKLSVLETQQAELEAGERYRRWGEAILANLWTLQQGQASLEWMGETIPLDPEIAPKDTAQVYFGRYRKAGRGLEQIEELKRVAASEVAYLDQQIALAAVAVRFDDIEALRHEWERLGPSARSGNGRERFKERRPGKTRIAPIAHESGALIYVGRTASQNEEVTFGMAGPDDYWLHARGVPGAHVVIKLHPGQESAPDSVLEHAAGYAAYLSASRNDSAVEVDVCRRRDVRKLKGGGPGLVTYRNERTIRVRPLSPP
jgi:predicted ribosome quality control (RQC) complex YloA/Tae2 family protein